MNLVKRFESEYLSFKYIYEEIVFSDVPQDREQILREDSLVS